MSERETQSEGSLQQWKGVDQRTQPTLVHDGFFSMIRGTFFGLGDNASRIPGKRLVLKLAVPVFNLYVFGDIVLVQGQTTLYMLPVSELNPIVSYLNYVSAGDANGVCYWLGTTEGASVWANPHTAGRLTVVKSSVDGGTEAMLVDRTSNDISTGNLANSFIGVDLGFGNSLKVNAYTIRNRASFTTESLRNWKLQGCNSVASNSVADWNAAAWTDLDTKTGNTAISSLAQWGVFPITLTAAYRYLRILQTGANSNGSNYLCMGEFEFYGKFYS